MDKTTYFKNAFDTVTKCNPESGSASNNEQFLGTLDGRPAYAYVRVAKINGGYNSSAESQFEDIHKFAMNEGYKITWNRVFFDRYGRQNLFGRPGIKSMLQEISKPEVRDCVVMVDNLWQFTNIECDWQKLGKICIESNNDIFVCTRDGYLLSMVLRILSDETSSEQKLKLMTAIGWEEEF